MIEPSQIEQEDGLTLTAKWKADVTFTYKVLLVYVRELHGTFTSIDKSETIKVNYKMSETERKICELITVQIERKLNVLMDGMVNFEVDEYFTKEPIDRITHSDALYQGIDGGVVLDPSRIPELKDVMKSFGSTLITFSLNDYALKLRAANGYAWEDRGGVYLEIASNGNKNSMEALFDLKYYKWANIMSTYIHEFIHTIELRKGMLPCYHTVLNQYIEERLKNYTYIDDKRLALYKEQLKDEINKAYLFHRAQLNGESVGIPFEFWAEEEKKYSKGK